ncbi:hypothetical protein H6S82_11560 [Planktothrix sp. FACHB-1355]|uniref:Uncharacterized protein n=1 Tax=Aerosakkonema funiforme FACHB-1375 TaxID=2949571 RepID=A0A926VJD1_9CYAN|nr:MULTISPECIES: hypothetical protein [Oscillatoriales]MBD2183599.1 hypothetical protein [Aerosakkonema funiforme FACHB-1375]MBD3559494.1 hypothetical protein [Planktothrix sp. FACHB-1355]
MLKALRSGAVLSAIAIATISYPAIGQPQITQYGFPVKSPEVETGDLPCYMITSNARTLDLGRLCGGTSQTATSAFQQSGRLRSVRRARLNNSQYALQYQRLADTYPDTNVRRRLAVNSSYTESVCQRLEQGLSVEQIRSEDIAQLQPSGNFTQDNARKQNIEITLKLAPQYYCPESSAGESGDRNTGSDLQNSGRRSTNEQPDDDSFRQPNLEPSRFAPTRNLEPSRLAPTPNFSITTP